MIKIAHFHRLEGGAFYSRSLRRMVVVSSDFTVGRDGDFVDSVRVRYSEFATPYMTNSKNERSRGFSQVYVPVDDLSRYFRSGFYNGRGGLVIPSMSYGCNRYLHGIRSDHPTILIDKDGSRYIDPFSEMYSWDLSVLDGYPSRERALSFSGNMFDTRSKKDTAYALSPYLAVLGVSVAVKQSLNMRLRELASSLLISDLILVDPLLRPVAVMVSSEQELASEIRGKEYLLSYGRYGESA